jgi:branched-chain amino acid transport system ATP-binding protein
MRCYARPRWSAPTWERHKLLEVSELAAGYLGQAVVKGVNLEVRTGEAVAIIGSNGAGKTTLFRAIAGVLRPMEGRVILAGRDVTRWPTQRIARAGAAYVPAERHLFPAMAVRTNLALGAYPRRPDRGALEMVLEIFPDLKRRLKQRAGTLSGGQQQMVAVGRALMSRPRLLMLDEPSTGLAPKLAKDAFEALASLKEQGMTLLVAEQQVPLALSIADRAYVLENGLISLEGTPRDLDQNPDVRRAYLGVA